MFTTRQLIKRWAWGSAAIGLFFIIIWQLKSLATLVLLSFLVAYILNPIVTRLDKLRFINRGGGTVITLFALLVSFLTIMFVIIPDVISEYDEFAKRLPDLIKRGQTSLIPWIENAFHVTVPESLKGDMSVSAFIGDLKEIVGSDVFDPSTEVGHWLLGGATGAVAKAFSLLFAVVGSLVFPLFLFFMLKDYPKIIEVVDDLIPVNSKEQAHQIGREVDDSLSAFLHGQFMVMLVLGTLYSIGYSLIEVPVAIGVGLLTGLLCFIPYVGAATGFLLALILVLLDFKGLNGLLGVVVVFGTVQTLDAVLITPKILGGKLGLRPLWIVVVLLAGAEMFGFLGVMLAVPTTAIAKILVEHAIARYKTSSVYLGQSTEPPDDPAFVSDDEIDE